MACLTADNPVHAGGSTTGKISPVQVKEIPARETFFKENEKKNLLNEKKNLYLYCSKSMDIDEDTLLILSRLYTHYSNEVWLF